MNILSGNFDPDAAALEGSGIYGLPFEPDEAKVVILPVPFEATTSYGGGTAGAPANILEASRQVDLFDLETGRPYTAGIAMLDISADILRLSKAARAQARLVLAKGGPVDAKTRAAAAKVNAAGEKLNGWVYRKARALLDQGKIVATLGGDHSVPFGAIQAYAEDNPGLGILHFDAHADLRDSFEGFTWSHASIFNNVVKHIRSVKRLVQVGVRDFGEREKQLIDSSRGRITTFFSSDLARRKERGEPFQKTADEIAAALPADVYISWDIDVFDPALCPTTGTPVPGGLSWQEAMGILHALKRAKKRIVGFDLCEVGSTEWDANVGARLLYKLIGFSLLTQAFLAPRGGRT